jgi:hypothetical protein
MNNINSGWQQAEIFSINDIRATPGTFKTSSRFAKPNKDKRPYGGRPMSIARLLAHGPTRHYVAQIEHDITG